MHFPSELLATTTNNKYIVYFFVVGARWPLHEFSPGTFSDIAEIFAVSVKKLTIQRCR